MKRLFISVILTTMAISGFAQLSQISVCGVKMGTDKKMAKSILQDRFGQHSVYDESGNFEIYDISIGGITYDYAIFFFAWKDGTPKFNGALFSIHYELDQRKYALNCRETIKSIYERKYDLTEYDGENGFKAYWFGEHEEVYGAITLRKSIGNDGKTRLYVNTIYFGPYDGTDDI